MTRLILYLLESSLVLVLLYLLYLLLLRREVFFSLNRYFLLSIMVLSLFFPVLRFKIIPSDLGLINQQINGLSDARKSYFEAFETWSLEDQVIVTEGEKDTIGTNYGLAILISIYGLGLVAMIVRLGWILQWIWRLRSSCPETLIHGVKVVSVPHRIAPFSFMNRVFVHGDVMLKEEFAQILAHEKAHIQERHSLDLILVQFLAAVLWFNPVAWLLIKSLKTTHEYIADKKMIRQGYSLVEYQTLLLKQLISNNSYGLVHNFNLSFIKKRITMMNITKSGWLGKVKVAFVMLSAVIFSLIIVECNSQLEEQLSLENSGTEDTGPFQFSVNNQLLTQGKLIDIYKIRNSTDFDGILKTDLNPDSGRVDTIHIDLVRGGVAIKVLEEAGISVNHEVDAREIFETAQYGDALIISLGGNYQGPKFHVFHFGKMVKTSSIIQSPDFPDFKIFDVRGEVTSVNGVSDTTSRLYLRAAPKVNGPDALKYRIFMAEFTLLRDGKGVTILRGGQQAKLTPMAEESQVGDVIKIEINAYQTMDPEGKIESIGLEPPYTVEIPVDKSAQM